MKSLYKLINVHMSFAIKGVPKYKASGKCNYKILSLKYKFFLQV